MTGNYTQQKLFDIPPLHKEKDTAAAALHADGALPLPGTASLSPAYRLLDPDVIQADPDQPRRYFDQQALLELAASIARVGLIEPLVVEERDAGRGLPYTLIAGERRHRAMLLGRRLWPENPHFTAARCLVYPLLPPHVRIAFQLEENTKRSSLEAYEVAAGLYILRARVMAAEDSGSVPDWDRISAMVGLNGMRKKVARWLRPR